MKVFLSHSVKDADFVKKLAGAIEAEGFTPWLCEVDVDTGENFVVRIEEGLREADLALLVWSPDAAKSRWTQEEWTAILRRQVDEAKIRLGVVLLRDYPLPQLLRTKHYIDARASPDGGIAKVLEWLKRRRDAGRLAGLSAPVFLPYRPKDVVARPTYLEAASETLVDEPSVFLLHGELGCGKSTLALSFA